MRLAFLGTAGYIDISSPFHALQSSTLVQYRNTTVMLDCGEHWTGRVHDLRPMAIVITHGHPDHFFGVKRGAPCPVWATAESWESARTWRDAVEHRRIVEPRVPFSVGGVSFEAFTLRHSTRAPAVGYRVTAGRRCVFYAPDVLAIDQPDEALAGIDLYIGDGAVIDRSLVRTTREGIRVGHASIRRQLEWCASADVGRAILTHCGSQITGSDPSEAAARVRRLGDERGVRAGIAHDGRRLTI